MQSETRTTTSIDLSYDHQTALALALPITLVMLSMVLVPHAILYRENAFAALVREAGVWMAVPAFLISIVVHELLHSVTAIGLARLRWRDVSYGVNWKTLTPYAHPRVPITARVYAFTAAMPGLVLGVVPSFVGLATGWGAWSGYGALMLAAAAGDVLILWSLRGVDDAALVQDHPSRVGCYVVWDGGSEGGEPPVVDTRRQVEGMMLRILIAGGIGAFLIGIACGSAAAIATRLG
jgi:hypothetical protein